MTEKYDFSELNLDDFLQLSDKGTFAERKLHYYEVILAALARKYIPEGTKVELNLAHVYKDTYLDVTIKDVDGERNKIKVSWSEV